MTSRQYVDVHITTAESLLVMRAGFLISSMTHPSPWLFMTARSTIVHTRQHVRTYFNSPTDRIDITWRFLWRAFL
jgi:hypothetical protein